MAEEQKPVAVPETAAPAAEPVAETTPAETAAAEAPATDAAAPAATETPTETKADETKAEEATEEAKKDEPKEETKPIEAGTLEHKGAPANFPKNLMYSKNYFWFGTDAMEKEKFSTYLKNEKAADVAHHVVSWATETGKGLLFYGKESDKSTPTGVIQLAETSEPTADGANKFQFTSKGHKHSFKAANAAERDNWVEQIKLKITEAKELAATVTESETYKKTLESFKPAAAPKAEEKKEEKTDEAAKEETPAEAAEEPKEEDKKDEKADEAKEEKKEEPKSRSASRKRASVFGGFLGKKAEAKKETPTEEKTEDKLTEGVVAEPLAEGAEADKPAEAETPAAEDKPAEEAKKEETPAKPVPTKRASLFGGLSFGKKKAEGETSAPATPAKETPPAAAEAPVAENAPVIPAVETTEPLSAEVASPATVPTETSEVAPATNGEKKDMKADKRKSSLPFNFGKKDKAAASSDEEGEKVKSPPLFSKLRQTMNRKGKGEKPADKAEEAKAEDKPAETEAAAEPAKEEEENKEEAKEEAKADEAAPAAAPVEEENAADKPAAATPAPVVAAA
ncbi:Pleckstrin homology domain-containing protein [Xylariomycetidae sp. FL0641]|nr:Pleckstrin homology domain-containing protein [Xylariomycetidae sp. FL0641]